MQREAIYSALFAKLTALTEGGSPLFKTATRKVKTWEDVPPEDSPALLLKADRERQLREINRPTKWEFDTAVLLYVHTGAQNDSTIVPNQVLNPLLDAIGACLPVDDQVRGACTLGGLVYSAAINGDIQIFLGSLGDEAVAVIPMRIITVGD